MKITITAGIKTINISNAIEERLNSSGDSLVTLPSLEELEEYIECGYKIDRIVIIEQAITDDGSLNDQTEIRNRVNDISSIIASREKDAEVVILTRYDEIADLIYEESLSIRARSCILVKDRPYSTSFFVGITTSDISNIDSVLIYKPKADVQWEESNDIENQTEDDLDLEDDTEWDFDCEDEEYDTEETDGWDNTSHLVRDITDINYDTGEIETYSINNKGTDNESNGRNDIEINTCGDEWDSIDSELENEKNNSEDKLKESEDYIEDWLDDQEDDWENTEDELKNTEDEWNDNAVDDILTDSTCNNTTENEVYNNNIHDETYSEDIANKDRISEDDIEEIEYSSKGNEDIESSTDWVDDTVYATDENTDKHEQVYDDQDESIEEIYKQNEEETKRNRGSISTGFAGRRNREQRQKSNDGIKINIDGGITTSELSHRMESFASRGNTIVMTGSGGTGTSILALNMANAIAKLGYSVIIVDMDTKHRAQSYMSKEAYNALEPDTSDLISAINSGAPVERFAKIIRPGIHLLSLWMGGDCVKASEVLNKDKITRFMNFIKTSYNFAIYDMTFEDATGFLQDIMFTADNIVNVVDSSNWGITKFMLDYCNIQYEDVQEAMFNRTELIFNKFEDINNIMGRKVKKITDILKILDDKVVDLTGVDSGLYFSNMHIAGIVEYDRLYENSWYNNKWVSDSKDGKERFIRLVAETVLY